MKLKSISVFTTTVNCFHKSNRCKSGSRSQYQPKISEHVKNIMGLLADISAYLPDFYPSTLVCAQLSRLEADTQLYIQI